MSKHSSPHHPVHKLIASRWSPYAFSSRPIPREDLLAIFEAARWAASSFNEQPWRYIIANRNRSEDFERILGCLLDGNQAWARAAPTLALGCTRKNFSRNGRPNRVAQHDLGLASASLTFEATRRGVYVHQMAGILPEKAREVFAIPEAFECVTGLALGYRAEPDKRSRDLHVRDERARTRRPLSEFVFGAIWGEPGLGSAHLARRRRPTA